MEKIANTLSIPEWESLIEDFESGEDFREKWLSQYPGPLIIDLAFSAILKKDFPLKSQLIIFMEQNIDTLISDSNGEESFNRVIEAFRFIIQAPVDGITITYALKEQMLVCVTSIAVVIDALHKATRHFESLVELLLAVINRPNHLLDRQTRLVACECLRELEKAYPCLLSEIVGHLWTLCQNERTHASQSYIILLTLVIHDIVKFRLNIPVFTTSVPLVPFTVPQFVIIPSRSSSGYIPNKEGFASNTKELRRVIAFLLERPQILTPCGMLEFMSMLIPTALEMEIQASLLKVQFSGLIYSYDPILCHVVLMLYSHFLDSFDAEENKFIQRLTLMAKESQQSLVFRLLALHWLQGMLNRRETARNNCNIIHISSKFYPSVFDPLALKALKLDLLTYCVICMDDSKSEVENLIEQKSMKYSIQELIEDGLVCVSSLKWLPPWSTETKVAFRTFHKILIGVMPHSNSDVSILKIPSKSIIYDVSKSMLVDMTWEFRRLVPVVVILIDRFLGCQTHRWLGKRLLQTFDEKLLPKLIINYDLSSYFPILDRIAENDTISPSGILELLTNFIIVLVQKHGPDTELKSWSLGCKVLGICRTMLMHHRSSRVFLMLSRLLAFICRYFPDLEVRDNSRIYLRMMLCIPGKKLRNILNLGELPTNVSPTPQFSSFLQVPSPRPSQDFKSSVDISSYIHLERLHPPLVKHTWSLALISLGNDDETPFIDNMEEQNHPSHLEIEGEGNFEIHNQSRIERTNLHEEPLRVLDSESSETSNILRRYFACIPDIKFMPGIKIEIPCTLRFESKAFNAIWSSDLSTTATDMLDALPALYAIVIKFSPPPSSYGSIPSVHIPFLLGEPSQNSGDPLDIVPRNGKSLEENSYRECVILELEPHEPVPGMVSVTIEANTENGQILSGPIQNIEIGIEDMFLKAMVPPDTVDGACPIFYSDLFDALWEACGSSSDVTQENFPLQDGKSIVSINGTRSVKLLEISFKFLVASVERHLAPFVVCVSGSSLSNIVKAHGIIQDAIWKDDSLTPSENNALVLYSGNKLQLMNLQNDDYEARKYEFNKRIMGCFHILVFLPPKFHLLLQIEVCDTSSLVRIRTDYWQSLAYIDDYLEALFLT